MPRKIRCLKNGRWYVSRANMRMALLRSKYMGNVPVDEMFFIYDYNKTKSKRKKQQLLKKYKKNRLKHSKRTKHLGKKPKIDKIRKKRTPIYIENTLRKNHKNKVLPHKSSTEQTAHLIGKVSAYCKDGKRIVKVKETDQNLVGVVVQSDLEYI